MSLKPLFAAALSLLCVEAGAQFFLSGDDPGYLKWNYITTPNYKVIYPKGMDSLAAVYARALESSRPKVALSSGYLPGENYGRSPVVLHAFTGVSNGSVAWAPMRMDLYTLPSAYSPGPIPWVEDLAVHENRHVAQMQFGSDGKLKYRSKIFGEMSVGASAGLYPGTWMLEGDAVVAETALTRFGRGRSGDFLSYYMAAFDRGDLRSWTQWRWGSFRRYAPDHYALGYVTIAGARYVYGDPFFMSDFLKTAANHPLRPSKVRAWFKERSGKHFYDAFKEDICGAFNKEWEEARAARGPVFEGCRIGGIPSWYTTFSHPLIDGNDILTVKSSLASPSSLVRVSPDGEESTLSAFASATSRLVKSGGKIYWTETIPDRRWGLAASSRLRVRLENGSTRDVTRSGRYFNPAVAPDGRIALTEYPFEGGSNITVLSPESRVLEKFKAPDGIQLVESAWINGGLAVSYIGPDGSGLGLLDGKGIKEIISQGPFSLKSLTSSEDGRLFFISDRSGISEVYFMEGEETFRLPTSKYGVSSFDVSAGKIVWAAREYEGNLLHSASLADIPARKESFLSWRGSAVADTLSAQEARLAGSAGIWMEDIWGGGISQPTPYNRLLNAIRIHSWLPLGIRYDSVSEISGDSSLDEASAGATVFFQNLLGNFSGLASYRYAEDELFNDSYRNSFHASLTYTGLYPVLEAVFDVGSRKAIQYGRVLAGYGDLEWEQTRGHLLGSPYVKAELKASVPLNFSRGGWSRGVIPQLEYVISNDRFLTGAPVVSLGSDLGPIQSTNVFEGFIEGDNHLLQTLTASLRAYTMRPAAASQVYPSLGIGSELGYRQRICLAEHFSPDLYWYVYGYLPGLTGGQGLRLTALGQLQMDATRYENAIKTRPRGLPAGALSSWMAAYAPVQIRFTADYAIPLYLGDIDALSPLTYIRNFVLTPHADYTYMKFDHGYGGQGGLASYGIDLTAKLANILWFPYDCELGVSFNYNAGPSFNDMKSLGLPLERTRVSMVFKTSL